MDPQVCSKAIRERGQDGVWIKKNCWRRRKEKTTRKERGEEAGVEEAEQAEEKTTATEQKNPGDGKRVRSKK